MLKVIHIAAGTLMSITPMPVDDPDYSIVYLDPPPPSSFVVEQLPSFYFLADAPLGVAYDNVSVQVASPFSGRSDLDCADFTETNITNLGSDPFGLDGDEDGIGCEE